MAIRQENARRVRNKRQLTNANAHHVGRIGREMSMNIYVRMAEHEFQFFT